MNFGGSKVQLDMEIDYTQAIRICMRNTLAAAMKLHFELDQGWHYTVLGPSNDTNSLANYLQHLKVKQIQVMRTFRVQAL